LTVPVSRSANILTPVLQIQYKAERLKPTIKPYHRWNDCHYRV